MNEQARGPLHGLRVLEVGGWLSVPYAGRLFALLGADVVKIELPGQGDPARRYGPFQAEDGRLYSGVFAYLNMNKRSVALDYRRPTGRRILSRLAAKADVLFTNLPPAEQDSLGLTYDQLCGVNPRLVVCSVTPFGRSGPYRDLPGVDLTVSAAAAISVGIGEYDEEPLPLPLFQTDMQAALAAACAALVALLARPRVGGQQIDIAAMEVMACHHAARNLPRYVYQGIVGIRRGRWGGDSPYPNTVLPCKDGHVILCAPQLAQWLRFLKVMGEPEWTQNPRYRDRRAMIADYPEEADALLIPWFKERTKAELLQIFIEHRIPFAPIFSGRELLECEHLRERGFFRPMPLGRDASGFVEAPGVPFRFGRSASYVERCGAPALGQDTRAVLVEELGLSPSEYESLVRAGLV